MLVLIFFLQSFLHPLSLHSFPTRRSSDLLTLAIIIVLPAHVSDKFTQRIALASRAALPGSAPHRACYAAPHEAPDRKSTRLNSSHTVISYAVFCLKKKNKKQKKKITYN